MRVLPVLFNTEMVRAILDGRKTVTRRVVKPQMDVCPSCRHIHADYIYDRNAGNIYCASCGEPFHPEIKPLYQTGDILYVRESWRKGYEEGTYIYKADDKLTELPTFKESSKLIYRPSIHMPKEAARIWLKVTDVRVERLHDITEEQAMKEGFSGIRCSCGRTSTRRCRRWWTAPPWPTWWSGSGATRARANPPLVPREARSRRES